MRAYNKLRTAVNTVLQCASAWRTRRRYLRVRAAVIVLQSFVRMWRHKKRYNILQKATLAIQANTRMYLARKSFRETVHSTVIIQKYIRRFLAIKEVFKRRNAAAICYRSPEDISMTSSITSFGYQTGSASLYSIDSVANALSPASGGATLPEMLANFALPRTACSRTQHNMYNGRSIFETEESGIETDTESMSGAREATDNDDQARVRRRRAKLQLIQQRASEEAVLSSDTQDDRFTESFRQRSKESNADNIHVPTLLKRERSVTPNANNANNLSSERVDFSNRAGKPTLPNSNILPSTITVRRKKRKSATFTCDDSNIVKINNSHQMKSVLGMFATKPEIEFMYSSNRRDFFFKEGIVSYRRIPTVSYIC